MSASCLSQSYTFLSTLLASLLLPRLPPQTHHSLSLFKKKKNLYLTINHILEPVEHRNVRMVRLEKRILLMCSRSWAQT